MFTNPEVRSWLSGTLKLSKTQEDEWGRALVKSARPDLATSKMWTGMFGQLLIQEVFPSGWKPKKLAGHAPDWETADYIIEVKTQSWFTPGTAGEKILGVPIKYRNVPQLYGKPLLIVCFGRAECIWFDIPRDDALKSIIQFWQSMGVTYQRGTELAPPSPAPQGSCCE